MFPAKQMLRNLKCLHSSPRLLSAKAGPLVDVAVDNEGIAVVTMQRPPVNSLNLDLLQALSNTLDEVEKNKNKGMILTSSSPTVFSAGLDIMEMYKPDMKRAAAFWTALQDVWLKLFGSKFPTAAAINGHSPAGGCLLSACCEYRVMVNGKYSIGLNETALGIIAPKFFMDTLCQTIPLRQAEIALTAGKLFPVEEALKVGLIDETASDKADAIEKCKKFIKIFDKVSPMARAITKQSIREAPLKDLQNNRKKDLDVFLTFVANPKIQQSLDMYLQKLKQKAAK